jgi:hypothetical protein
MLDGRHRFMTPRWSFPPRSATGQLGGIDRIKLYESCKMIGFEVVVRPLKALAARGEGSREPDWPGVATVEAASRHHGVIFSRFLRPSDPAACLRQRGPCGKNRPPVGALFGPILLVRACCRSSVVEHSIGNGEVDSSILSGSTIPLDPKLLTWFADGPDRA